MEKDKNYNPRDILRALKKRKTQRLEYEWQVQVHIPVETVLAMIQNRHNPEWRLPKEPYTVSANFDTLAAAQEYALMVRLTGRLCTIKNNWTGDEYDKTC